MLTLLALVSLLGQSPARPALKITAVGFQSDEGKALVFLYRDEKDWNDTKKAYRKHIASIRAGRAETVFEGLAPGVYAVAVVHDENDNGELDFSWFPVPGPEEGAGTSNDAPARFGPPKWQDARFPYSESGASFTIRMRY